LFEGELKLIEPHLDLFIGCTEIKYKWEKKNLRVYVQEWEKGEVVEELASIE